MQALAIALAGCMEMDLIHILQKGRHDLRRTWFPPGAPARAGDACFTAVALHFVSGTVASDQIQRRPASAKKYCQVWN